MNRKKSVILVGSIIVGVIVISLLPPMVFSSFDWGVEVGDTMTFKVIATGMPTFYGGAHFPSWIHLNNTIIIANVTYLPALGSFYTSHTFTTDVVNKTKVTCRFQNGTVIQGRDSIVMNLISMSLLPANSWNDLDSLFLDDYIRGGSFSSIEYTWVSRFEEGDFFFGHQGHFPEGKTGWKTLVNMTTGIPFVIENYDHIHGGWDNLRLDLFVFDESGS